MTFYYAYVRFVHLLSRSLGGVMFARVALCNVLSFMVQEAKNLPTRGTVHCSNSSMLKLRLKTIISTELCVVDKVNIL